MTDVIANALNGIMNAKRARRDYVVVKAYSKFLLDVLDIAKKEGYILEYQIEDEKHKKLKIKFSLDKCAVIKPRFYVKKDDLDKYIRRFLPARDFGIIIISTSMGLMTHNEAIKKNIGGGLIAYFF